jgi:hypothetical protein
MASVLLAGGCVNSEVDTQEAEIGAVVVTQWNDSTELFLEYPHPVAGEATGNWAIHLTDMDDFKPIRSESTPRPATESSSSIQSCRSRARTGSSWRSRVPR